MEQKNQTNRNISSLLISAVVILGAYVYTIEVQEVSLQSVSPDAEHLSLLADLESQVLPSDGVVIPIRWGDLGARLIESGVIDAEKLEIIYAQRGGLSEEERLLLYGNLTGDLRITQENSGFLLNLFWALGLSNKNEVLDFGPMVDRRYGGAGGFASTGGWTLAKGGGMNHYSRHSFMALTKEQQELVRRVSQNIYRPCCDNSTFFPDCNHGMAMFGLLELMASQGLGEEEMYRYALSVNSYWFPETYMSIAKYFQKIGIDWAKADSEEVLGKQYSSASGYGWILSQLETFDVGDSSGCGL